MSPDFLNNLEVHSILSGAFNNYAVVVYDRNLLFRKTDALVKLIEYAKSFEEVELIDWDSTYMADENGKNVEAYLLFFNLANGFDEDFIENTLGLSVKKHA